MRLKVKTKKVNTSLFSSKANVPLLSLCAWLLVYATVVSVKVAAASPLGLDSRPVNTTCLAFERPNTDASVQY